MYSNDDIQEMIERVNNDGTNETIIDVVSAYRNYTGGSVIDNDAIREVLRSGYYETFDRYDSDVCEQFIRAFEKVYCVPFT